ncbi:MAG TPA: hypothetical protein VFT99_14380, partial [Roseiflexaceae bacterium]|nr:hypothetical protein [Roseiflexaceae bacterium]
MDVIYDEARVPAYTLPDPLIANDGGAVRDARMWNEQRRAELLELFAEHVYGRTPTARLEMRVEQRAEDRNALDGAATRRELRLHFGNGQGPAMDL